MLLKLRGLEGKVLEAEVDMGSSFGVICDRAGKDFGYHGRFTLRLPSGALAPRDQNLEDNEEFLTETEETVYDLVVDTPAENLQPAPESIGKPAVVGSFQPVKS